MEVFAAILTILLAVMCAASAVADFTMATPVVEAVDRLGLSRQIIPLCGISKACGAVGLLIGFGNDSLRLFAAAATTAYFVCAVAVHARRRDTPANTAPAAVFLAVATVTLVATIVVV